MRTDLKPGALYANGPKTWHTLCERA